jgi:hypothetical protein
MDDNEPVRSGLVRKKYPLERREIKRSSVVVVLLYRVTQPRERKCKKKKRQVKEYYDAERFDDERPKRKLR